MENNVTYTVNSASADGECERFDVSLPTGALVKPEELGSYVGKVLSFHNGRGYVVTAKLLKAEIPEADEYSYDRRYDLIDYSEELDMSWFYEPENELAEYETMMYAYTLKVQGIVYDGDTMNVKYVAVPTREELDFRERILALEPSQIEKRYKELKKLYD